MGVSRFAPDYNLAFPYTADASIAARACVAQSTTDYHVTNASGEGASNVLGVADNAISSGAVGRVCTRGIVECTASGTITRGDLLVVADSTGKVKTYDSSKHYGATIVGRAEASGVNLDAIPVQLLLVQADSVPAAMRINFRARVVAVANVAVATGLAAGQVIDGVTLVAGDRVLLANQTVATENGLYVAPASGAGSFAPEWKTGLVMAGCTVSIGSEQTTTTWKNSEWKATLAQTVAGGGYTIGTDDPTFYPKTQWGSGAVGTQVTGLFAIHADAPRTAIDTTGANAVKAVLATGASRGAGTLDFTGTGTDTIKWAIFNW